MQVLEFTRQKIKLLEACSPVDVRRHYMAILESFILLEKDERKVFAETLYKWAGQNKAQQPLLFSYSKLLFAFHLFYNEQYDESFPLLTEAEHLFTGLNDLDGAALCKVIKGGINRTFGNIDLALQGSLEGHEQLLKSGASPHFLMACNINIGNIYYERHHYDEAIPLFKSTLEIAEPSGKLYWIIYALHGLGKVYLAQQKYPAAKECLEKAMHVAERFNNPVSVCNSLSELGNYHFTVGNYPEAENFHERALALRKQNHFTGGAITSCIRLAEIYIKDVKPAKAVVILDSALQLAAELKVKMKMYQVHLLLSQIYEAQDEPVKSLFHFKQFYELREQVEQEDNERKIKNAQLVFEGERTKKENVIIKKQKEEIEKKNIELQETIDKLTRARVGKKARAITLVIAIVLFMFEDLVLHFALTIVNSDNYFISIIVKMAIIFSLSPINKAIEAYLLKKVVKKRKEVLV